ncbi:MAG: hypothetical protein ACD_18C00186G0002 [uncultured bacterium]|nr:MAG: hypothetical protein ACD_18C00186G0002 [uncultured bacterium]OGH84234.1 MAG: hypothetical protein A2488_00085 [Candidatus Magasanikbacteria bacterium RIFOXYC12_FULL_32_21b]OGH89483.1 MAG: hypothetical protein A2507_02190 [Candidatus Magasanikbacteria bacterium RIFOXYD12_FULL_33_17]HAO52727.1 hypothetical protein [Candidatus Magasanikbacteria bacterium]
MSSPESSYEQQLQIETERIIKEWKKNPVYLASTSSFRKEGLEKLGFEDVRTESVPDARERETHKKYDDNFAPNFIDKKGRGHTQDISRAKLQAIKVPLDCFGVAIDTMPYRYVKNSDYGKDQGFGSYWRAEPMNKPETLDNAKAEVINTFLLLTRNYLRSMAMKRIYVPEGGYSDDYLAPFNGGMNPEITVEVITSIAFKIPGSDKIENYPVDVRLLPKKIYQLAKAIFSEMEKELKPGQNVSDGYDYILDELEVEDLRRRVLNGKELEEYFMEMANDIFAIMIKEGAKPTKISGGINYGSKAVRDYLNMDEMLFSGSDMEDGIYLGFPQKNIERIINKRARSVALENL